MSIFTFPNQRIPESQKNKEWHEKHIINYMTYSTSPEYSERRAEMLELYYAAAAKLSPAKTLIVESTMTKCYGPHLGPKYEVYPLIESQIEQLLGQYRERPLRRRAIVRNEGAVIKKLDTKLDYLAESFLRKENEEIQQSLGFVPETENPDLQLPEDIDDWFETTYRTQSEETAEDIAHQLLVVKKGKEDLYNMLFHYLVSETCYCVLDEKDKNPKLFVPHPLDCYSDTNPMEDIQGDLTYFVFDKYMSANEIFNMFDLNEDDKKTVENYSGIQTNGFERRDASATWYRKTSGTTRVRVVSMYWLSRRKTNFKIITNRETGNEEYKILPPEYKIRNRDEITSVEIDDVRHITMIGPNLTLSYGRLDSKNQLRTIGNDKKRFIPVVGLIGKNNTGIGNIRSLAKKLEWLQDFASDIIYELKLSLRYVDGNVIVYDLSNIPKQFLKDSSVDNALKKVQLYLKRDRMMLINSKDKRQNTYASSVNLSQSKRMNDLLLLLSTIESIASRISGINDNMQGQNNSYEKTGVAEMKLAQASARVENYFGVFDSFIDIVIERMCIQARFIYREGQVFNYFAGDGSSRFMTIFPDFFLEDIGLYFDDNRKEFQKKKLIDDIALQTFSRSQYPELLLSMLKIFNADTSNEAEKQLKKGLRTFQELQEENRKVQMEQEQNLAKIASEDKSEDRNLKREGYQKDVVVANIYSESEQEKTATKEDNENRRKAAEIEKEILLNGNKENKN